MRPLLQGCLSVGSPALTTLAGARPPSSPCRKAADLFDNVDDQIEFVKDYGLAQGRLGVSRMRNSLAAA